ncbi:MAG: transporter substrate-binding domain-containing protein [Siculibacillus sp.]|nr:transporter substrate-binding domain-containing protein [Siculibacillus sp.]
MIASILRSVSVKLPVALASVVVLMSVQPGSAQEKRKPSSPPAAATSAAGPTANPSGTAGGTPAGVSADGRTSAAPADDAAQPAARPAPPKTAFPNFWDPESRPRKPTSDVGAIRFLTTGDFPPFGFLDGGGRLTGYHVDLARLLCAELGAACTIQMRPFDDLANALAEKRGDAIIAGLRVTSAMRARLDTSAAYLTTPGRFVVRDGTKREPTPEGLAGRWISVVSGSAHERFVLDAFAGSRIAAYPDEAAARDALRDGVVEAHFGDAIGLAFWLDGEAARRCCTFLGGPWLESSYFGEGLNIAVAKGNFRLKRGLDYALQRLAEDGKLAEIYLRWFPRGYY